MRSVRIRNTEVQKEICWITNCQGIARRVRDRRDLGQGSEGWMMEVTKGLEEQMRTGGRVTHEFEEPTMACDDA
eukprot:4223027-Alexandrium_andersonii.AAC.1